MYTLQGFQGLSALGCGATACAECKAKQGLGDDTSPAIDTTDTSLSLPGGIDTHQVADVVVYGFAAYTIWQLVSSFFGTKVQRVKTRRKRISQAKEDLAKAKSLPLF